MLPEGPEKQLAAEVARLVHDDRKRDAAALVADTFEIKVKLTDDNPDKYLPILQNYLHVLLENKAPEEAAELLWKPNLFTPRPKYTRDIWKLFDTSSQGLIMGAGSCSKSFGMGVRLLLEYTRDPEWTTIKVIGPSEDHLQANLFSHLVSLHGSASLPLPGEVGELFIGLNRRNLTSAIKGVVIPIGKTKKAGRLQGTKRKPRPRVHPVFGPLSRLFIFIDELENVPGGLWADIDNVLSNAAEEPGQFGIWGAFNPTNQQSESAKRAEPPFSWQDFDVDKHYEWKSTRGWDVLRLDGEKCENVVEGKTIYPGLQTRQGLEAIAKNSGGRNSPGYSSMGRGAYPPTGIELAIIPPGMFNKMRGEFVWLDAPVAVGACDLAFEGKAAAVFTLGKWGKATGMKLPPTLELPLGVTVMFKDDRGRVIPQWGLQADQQFTLPKAETVAMTKAIIEVCKKAGVKPEYFSCDRTGAGAGTADLIKHDWSPAIHDLNYSQSPSKGKIMSEDTKTCEDEFDRVCSELWYALRAFGEFGYLLLNPAMGIEVLAAQITNRKAKTGKIKKVESKKDYMSRGKESPDEADSLTLFVHAARKGSGVVLSMKRDNKEDPGDEEDDWYSYTLNKQGGAYISSDNCTDALGE